MNIKRKAIIVEIEGTQHDFILDFESAINFQDMYGKSIFIGMDKISKEQDLKAMVCLIASCLKNENGKSVGMDFVNGLDLMTGLPYFMDKMGELMENSLPKETDNKKKPVTKKKN